MHFNFISPIFVSNHGCYLLLQSIQCSQAEKEFRCSKDAAATRLHCKRASLVWDFYRVQSLCLDEVLTYSAVHHIMPNISHHTILCRQCYIHCLEYGQTMPQWGRLLGFTRYESLKLMQNNLFLHPSKHYYGQHYHARFISNSLLARF